MPGVTDAAEQTRQSPTTVSAPRSCLVRLLHSPTLLLALKPGIVCVLLLRLPEPKGKIGRG